MRIETETAKPQSHDFCVSIAQETLSDGSHVFNVRMGEAQFACVDEGAAIELADAFVGAINSYTVNTAVRD